VALSLPQTHRVLRLGAAVTGAGDQEGAFIPYDSLTEAVVISWIPANQIDSAQSCVQGQIDSMITPPVSPANTALPWVE
jgi:hypothetical protein